MTTNIFPRTKPKTRGEIDVFFHAEMKGLVSDAHLVSRFGDTAIFYDFKTVKELYRYCRNHNFNVLDERTNVERYIQDGELL